MTAPLTPGQRRFRIGLILAACMVFGLLGLRNLLSVSPSLPCGFKALTGLPCLFCGGTRAACAAMRGDFGYSLQLNALSIPLLFLTLLGAFTAVAEILRGRALAPWHALCRKLMRRWPMVLILLLAWWGFHLTTALRSSNLELIDPSKPIAARLRALLQP